MISEIVNITVRIALNRSVKVNRRRTLPSNELKAGKATEVTISKRLYKRTK